MFVCVCGCVCVGWGRGGGRVMGLVLLGLQLCAMCYKPELFLKQ